MEEQQRTFLLVVGAALACFIFLSWENIAKEGEVALMPPLQLQPAIFSHRSLRFSQLLDPKSVVPRVDQTKLTIYLLGEDLEKDHVFGTGILQRYGTGRFNYVIKHEYNELDRKCEESESEKILPSHDTPCLAVFFPRPRRGIGNKLVKCNYPRCQTMVMADEICRFSDTDVRQHYSSHPKFAGKGYLPLGPRLDSWTSFQEIQTDPLFDIAPASKRKWAFNAIFSASTSPGRTKLATILEEQQDHESNLPLPIFKAIAKEWDSHANDPNTPQLHTSEYMKLLLDSVFTLAPAGHNPECYRLFEAVETGSIPILLRNDMLAVGTGGYCKESLIDWMDSPVVILDSWEELYPMVTELLADLEKLNDVQVKLRLWYDEYMSKVISKFEDFMIMSYAQDLGEMEVTQSRQ